MKKEGSVVSFYTEIDNLKILYCDCKFCIGLISS